MVLTAGSRLGVYDILSPLGVGGMGEVYRAKDTKLGRDVALKVLPDSLAHDPERLARFEREAHLLAALNHPNIAHVYGIEDTTGVRALVMELVEGATLADRISQGPIPLDEALPIAKQIAEALEAAHEQGIIHRDLKPANIKVRADGTVKVLDFGLAKAFDPSASTGAGATMSPTLSLHATQAGIILGTAAYMAPEQARGKTVDRRADIWAFGCVLFEMLTGRRAFDGDDISTTLASVLKTEPDWQLLPRSTPAGVRRLLVRCLKKEPKDRLQAIGDARVELADLLSGHSEDAALLTMTPGGATVWDRLPWVIADGALLAFIVTAAVAGWLWWERRAAEHAKVAFDIVTDTSIAPNQFALSPDGTRLVAVITGASGPALWLRRLDEVDGHILVATLATTGPLPFWSADSRFLAFFADGKLNKIDASGGPSQALCDAQVGDPVCRFHFRGAGIQRGGGRRCAASSHRARSGTRRHGAPASQILARRPALHLPCAEHEGREYRAVSGLARFTGDETAGRERRHGRLRRTRPPVIRARRDIDGAAVRHTSVGARR